jgi:large subunit ribosomal protein L17
MRHRVAGRKLGRTTEHRIALLRNLTTQLFAHERIHTTLAKAKALRPFAEKLVTVSKKGTLHARRQVLQHVHDRAVVAKLFDTLSARYDQRPGGYTRIIKLGPRRGDNAEMALIELVGSDVLEPEVEPTPKKKATKKKVTKKKVTAKKTTTTAETPKATKKKTAKKKAAKKKTASKSKD